MSATVEHVRPSEAPCEVGRYQIGGEARVLVGRRIDGVVHIFDQPRHGRGRRYFVDAGFESKGELAVLLADYRRRAALIGRCPMAKGGAGAELDLPVAEPSPPQDRTP